MVDGVRVAELADYVGIVYVLTCKFVWVWRHSSVGCGSCVYLGVLFVVILSLVILYLPDAERLDTFPPDMRNNCWGCSERDI